MSSKLGLPPLTCLDNWEFCAANGGPNFNFWNGFGGNPPIHGNNNMDFDPGFPIDFNEGTGTNPITCPPGKVLNNGVCVDPNIYQTSVINQATGQVDILTQAKAFAASNPLIAYGGLALVAYLLFVKK